MSLFQRFNISLGRALTTAAIDCPKRNEEEGGVILKKIGGDAYTFVKVKNLHEGTPTAYGLYVVEPENFGEMVIPALKKRWELYASFHTHPQFSSTPSSLDYEKLFQGFKYNYIYSHMDREFSCSDWSRKNELHTIKIKLETLQYYTIC
jgi:proteasome lid subunit RPN8/RPN11